MPIGKRLTPDATWYRCCVANDTNAKEKALGKRGVSQCLSACNSSPDAGDWAGENTPSVCGFAIFAKPKKACS